MPCEMPSIISKDLTAANVERNYRTTFLGGQAPRPNNSCTVSIINPRMDCELTNVIIPKLMTIDRERFASYRDNYWTLDVATVCRVRNGLRFRAVG